MPKWTIRSCHACVYHNRFPVGPFVCRAAEDDGATIFRRCQAVANFDVKATSLPAISDFDSSGSNLAALFLYCTVHAYLFRHPKSYQYQSRKPKSPAGHRYDP